MLATERARWAEIVGALLRRDGRIFIREMHPMLWTLSEPRPDGLLVVEYPYFETAAGTEFHEELTYTPQSEPLTSPITREWNHGIGEIFSAIAAAGLHVDAFEEHTSVPCNPLGEAMVETDCRSGSLLPSEVAEPFIVDEVGRRRRRLPQMPGALGVSR